MESAIGLYKTELTGRRGPWRDLAHVEMETAGYLHWFNYPQDPLRDRGRDPG